MGTIAEKLSYLNGTKTAIKNAIVNKGVEVSDTDTFRSYADKVQQIINNDMLRQRVDQTNSADYLFFGYGGDDLEFINKLDTSNITSMKHMFGGCKNIENIPFGPDFKTHNVTNMTAMFSSCTNLKTLDLSNFDMSNTIIDSGTALDKDGNQMFYNTNISKITLPKALNTNTVFKLPGNYVLRDDPNIVGNTLNSFTSYLSTDTQKRDIVQGYKISITGGYGDLLTDGTETNSAFIFGNILGQETTVTINANTITIGGKIITANSNETSEFIEWRRGGEAITGTWVLGSDETIVAVYSELPMPIFNITLSGVAGVSRYRLPDGTLYDFSNDIYDGVVNNETRTVQLKKYTQQTTTRVVIPSQMIIDNKLYSVDINSIGNAFTRFFANSSKATNIQFISINETYMTGSSMSYMFAGCKKLAEIDLSGMDLANVTKYSSMFGSALGGVPKTCLIYVKDQASLDWMTSHFSSYKNVQIKGA